MPYAGSNQHRMDRSKAGADRLQIDVYLVSIGYSYAVSLNLLLIFLHISVHATVIRVYHVKSRVSICNDHCFLRLDDFTILTDYILVGQYGTIYQQGDYVGFNTGNGEKLSYK